MVPRPETEGRAAAGTGRRLISALSCLAWLAGCDDLQFPRDPNDTLETVLASEQMTVAAVDHVPWVRVAGGADPSGAEVALIEDFARELGVTVEWKHMPSFVALEGLEQGQIDLAIGGFVRRSVTPHAGAAPSYAYFREALVIGAEPEHPIPDSLDGQAVFVPAEVMAAGLVRDRGGLPVSEMTEDVRLVALPRWQLADRDLVPTGIVLQRQKHVMAVPQGENAWLMRLERFLRGRTTDFAARLREHRR